jgi:hypothetical protein
MLKNLIKIAAVALLVVLGVVFVSALIALPTMLLWNWLMPTIFALPKITLFQAWGLMVLSGFLFKSTVSATGSNK